MYLSNITFNKDIVFDSNRESHSKHFKIKKRKKTYTNYRKPIYEKNNRMSRRIGYEKEKVIEKTFVIFEKGLSIDFNDNITIIVGDNGCGKTSLLNMLKIKNIKTYYNNDDRKLTFKKHCNLFIGKELHKNAIIDDFKNSKMTLNINEVSSLFNMQTSSNGENMLDLFSAISTLNNTLIVLDEPETSLSIKSQKNISNLIKQMSKTNQIIIVTHSPIIMSLSDIVYDLETKQYINTNIYINNQLN